MGEYAIRKRDRTEIKIGTCADMYYLRFEDRDKVSPRPGSVDISANPDGNRFRLPFPDEDHLQPGEYDEHNRSLRLYRTREDGRGHDDFTDPERSVEPGLIQLRHDSGLLLNVPCYHGEKLPEVPKTMSVFWNGKNYAMVLSALRVIKADDGTLQVFPVIRCRFCDHAWRYEWADVLPFIGDKVMRERLEVYATQPQTV